MGGQQRCGTVGAAPPRHQTIAGGAGPRLNGGGGFRLLRPVQAIVGQTQRLGPAANIGSLGSGPGPQSVVNG